eukprot:TRINITY_DN32218_c0_g1_i3.p1 TRINITY_DN32218_c0_g1~~TRINITY_DN32218_c0_g1_i3.p1  ORF type:complete len:519 (-),score=106.16 TRINITY_DN32218_c0_g1_i3:55-1611(-)
MEWVRRILDKRNPEHPCRIVSVCAEEASPPPARASEEAAQSAASQASSMRLLLAGFQEQYIESLAEETADAAVTAYCAKISAAASGEALLKTIQKAWQLPSMEVRGRVVSVATSEPGQQTGPRGPRGSSVLGPSVDSRRALRAAAGGAGEYPANARPKALSQLATAIGVAERCVVWCHGASDVIVRISALATRRVADATSDEPGDRRIARALEQHPTWPNAASLLKSGGIGKVESVPYYDPWLRDSAELFWEALEEKVLGSEPPDMVYLVHPHFPCGWNAPDFGERLQDLVQRLEEYRPDVKTIFAVDQTYAGFVEETEDQKMLVKLATGSDNVVLIRSLSKVEGLANLRLGCAVGSGTTAQQLSNCLPFAGGLYVSELALDTAVAALCGPGKDRHRDLVHDFYSSEQEWLRAQLEEVGMQTWATPCPFFVARAPEKVVASALRAQVAIQGMEYPEAPDAADEEERAASRYVCCLVADRETNLETIEAFKKGFAAEEAERPAGLPSWVPTDLVKSFQF